MKRIQLALMAIMAMLALTAITATTAAAEEETKILPIPTATEPVLATATSGEGELEQVSGSTVKCKKDKGSVNFTTPNLGTGIVLFEGCSSTLKSVCTGVGDETGTINQSGSVHYILALEMVGSLKTTLVPAFAFLVKQFHFACKTTGVELLVLVRGCVAGKADGGTVLQSTVSVLFGKYTKGENSILSILPEETTKEVPCLLESSIEAPTETGIFELSALIGSALFEKWTKDKTGGNTSITVLLMN